jgi:hypothetical protein
MEAMRGILNSSDAVCTRSTLCLRQGSFMTPPTWRRVSRSTLSTKATRCRPKVGECTGTHRSTITERTVGYVLDYSTRTTGHLNPPFWRPYDRKGSYSSDASRTLGVDGACLPCTQVASSGRAYCPTVAETNRMQMVIFSAQCRTSRPYKINTNKRRVAHNRSV